MGRWNRAGRGAGRRKQESRRQGGQQGAHEDSIGRAGRRRQAAGMAASRDPRSGESCTQQPRMWRRGAKRLDPKALAGAFRLTAAGPSVRILSAMEQTLLLNASYEPLKVVHWQKAITLWCQGKVEIISVYDREVRGGLDSASSCRRSSACFATSASSAASTTCRSRARTSTPATTTRASTAATRCRPSELTFDHVVPVAQGGRQGLGEHRHLLRLVQPARRAAARRRRRGCA